jgi:hypothetical protein
MLKFIYFSFEVAYCKVRGREFCRLHKRLVSDDLSPPAEFSLSGTRRAGYFHGVAKMAVVFAQLITRFRRR